MYMRHKTALILCVLICFTIAFAIDLNFSEIAEASITVASIAMGVYIATASALLGSPFARKLKSLQDKKIPTKSSLGVLSTYFRTAGLFCVLLIVISCVYLISSRTHFANCAISFLKRFASATAFSVFSVNILFLWLILLFLVNSLGKPEK